MATDPVLVIQHEDACPPAWLGEWLTAAGVSLDVRRPYAGQRLPDSLVDHAGLVVLGGSMGAYDDAEHPWLTPTKALLRQAVAGRVPTLGVCLGHQLASVSLGGAVARHPHGRQVGLLPVRWTSAAADDPLFGAIPRDARAVQWNNDVVVEPPLAARLVAGTGRGGPQVLRLGPRAWGVQFHPEVDLSIVSRWTQSYEREPSGWDVGVRQMLAALAAAEGELRRTWRPMADRFAALVGADELTARRRVPESSRR